MALKAKKSRMKRTCIFALALFVAGCTEIDQRAYGAKFARLSVDELWEEQKTNQSALELSFIEAELGSRGRKRTRSSYLGARTHTAVGKSRYQRKEVRSRTPRKCSDFSRPALAQRFFLFSGGPQNDRNGLDPDGDGFACSWGQELREVAANGVIRGPKKPFFCYSTLKFHVKEYIEKSKRLC